MSLRDSGKGRNFRVSYLGSLGISNVRQAIDGILKENVIDLSQLKKVAHKFELPSSHRPIVWNLLLGVLPIYKESWEFAREQLDETYADLKHSSSVVQRNPPLNSTPNSPNSPKQVNSHDEQAEEVYRAFATFMYFHSFVDEEDPSDVRKIAAVHLSVLGSQSLAFASLRGMLIPHGRVNDPSQITADSFRVANRFLRLLEAQDLTLWKLLRTKNVPVEHISFGWIRTYFAGRLPEKSLPLLWDKLFSRSSEYKACVALALVLLIKHKLVATEDANAIRVCLKTEPIPSVDGLISKANELFTGLGSESKDESPPTSGPLPTLMSPH